MNKQELTEFICDMFNVNECPEMILRQIHKYVTERRYSYLDIARALSYYVDVRNGTLDIKYGIGIVAAVMDEARKYFKGLELQRQQQIKAAEEAKKKEQPREIKIATMPRQEKKKRPHIDISKLQEVLWTK